MFTSYPTYSRYRTLWLTSPAMRGEDVFALQNALYSVGYNPGPFDGILGKDTAAAIRSYQHAAGLEMDGKAGGDTQKSLALSIARRARNKWDIASGAMHGQMEHESGFRLGNYSVLRDDGSWDIGVVQRNSAHLNAIRDAYMVESSINLLAKNTHDHFVLFEGVASDFRRWALAMGAWNAPAFACWIANEEGASVPKARTARPGEAARRTFEAYMASVTTHLNP